MRDPRNDPDWQTESYPLINYPGRKSVPENPLTQSHYGWWEKRPAANGTPRLFAHIRREHLFASLFREDKVHYLMFGHFIARLQCLDGVDRALSFGTHPDYSASLGGKVARPNRRYSFWPRRHFRHICVPVFDVNSASLIVKPS